MISSLFAVARSSLSSRSSSLPIAIGFATATLSTTNYTNNNTYTCQCDSGSQNQNDDDVDNDEWKFPNRSDFDMYIDNPTRDDLIKLYTAHQRGKEVWPWIWTQPNTNGPHHVFVGPISIEHLKQIKALKDTIPNCNLLVITTEESLKSLPEGEESLYQYECGLVIDTPVKLLDSENKILMLEDERVVNYTKLYRSE